MECSPRERRAEGGRVEGRQEGRSPGRQQDRAPGQQRRRRQQRWRRPRLALLALHLPTGRTRLGNNVDAGGNTARTRAASRDAAPALNNPRVALGVKNTPRRPRTSTAYSAPDYTRGCSTDLHQSQPAADWAGP